ncbi:hypothetical protein K504DRAFT_471687 [Pleomassaria siparia CBS 279.74]|uniref:BTB domain-containing protein n=1 Tax=Pleomassaria siparia CBS 279.74 TaxID=1314801 RepID=A0A6G1JX53_9PLEO|nr:hypothetical protein K504DRAFT_471687 [Pleomassaria siparia CBS 279.74]
MPFNNTRVSTLGHTFRNFDQTIITIKVGRSDPPESFSCHRTLLSRCSGFFDRCFQQEGVSPYKNEDSSLELEDTHPDVFDAFMIWLYTGHIPHHLIEGRREETVVAPRPSITEIDPEPIPESKADQDDVDTVSWGISLDNDDPPTSEQHLVDTSAASETGSTGAEKVPGSEGEPEKSIPMPPLRATSEKTEAPKETLCRCCSRPYKWRGLEGFLERRFIALYIFANRYEIPELRRDVVVAWQTNDEMIQSMPDHGNVISAYDGLPPNSPLCRMFLDMYSVYWNPARDTEQQIALRSQLPQAFLFELATMLAKGERQKTEKDWCEFHEHETDEDRKVCYDELMKDPTAGRALRRIRDSKSWKGLVLKKGKR